MEIFLIYDLRFWIYDFRFRLIRAGILQSKAPLQIYKGAFIFNLPYLYVVLIRSPELL